MEFMEIYEILWKIMEFGWIWLNFLIGGELCFKEDMKITQNASWNNCLLTDALQTRFLHEIFFTCLFPDAKNALNWTNETPKAFREEDLIKVTTGQPTQQHKESEPPKTKVSQSTLYIITETVGLHMIPKEIVSLWGMCQEREGTLKSLLESWQQEGKPENMCPRSLGYSSHP